MIPENWDAVRLLLASQSQWRRGPSGHIVGLDYAGCRAAAKGARVGWRKNFDKLRIAEAAVLEEAARR